MCREGEKRDAAPTRTLSLGCQTGHCARLSSRPDVLVYAEEIVWIVFLFEHRKAFVVFPVARFNASLAFVIHHEVDITATWIEFVNCFPVRLSPARQCPCILRVAIDTCNHH